MSPSTSLVARYLIALVLLVALLPFAGPAFSANVTFEDIPVPPGPLNTAPVPPGYQGLNWSDQWNVSSISSGWFPVTSTPSGQNYAWSNDAHDILIVANSGATFDFAGGWLASGFFGNTGQAVARGFVGVNEAFTQSFTANNTFQAFTFNFTGIDRLAFTDQHGNLLLDDLNITVTPAVPEPEIYAMMGVGLALVGWAVRRRKKQAAAYPAR